jgi:translocation and assembly module TamB
MRVSRKLWRTCGLVGVSLLFAVFAVRVWLVPSLIVSQMHAHYGGHIMVRDWWVNGSSAGIVGLHLCETPDPQSPVWFSVERVSTNLSFWSILAGRFTPENVSFESPQLTVRVDRDGILLTRPPFHSQSSEPTRVPDVIVNNALVRFRQDGRPAMVVQGINAHLAAEATGQRISAETNDPTWGPWEAVGHFNADFQQGQLELAGTVPAADLAMETSIPFVTATVWQHVVPRGRVDLKLLLTLHMDQPDPLHVRTEVGFRETTVELPAIGFTSTATTGDLTVENAVVKLNEVAGRIIDGDVQANGTLDFSSDVSDLDLGLGLKRLDVTGVPASWGIQPLGATGRLTGDIHLRVALPEGSADFTRSLGSVVVEEATLHGVPLKSLRLAIHRDANNERTLSTTALEAGESVTGRSRDLLLPKTIDAEVALEDVSLNDVVKGLEESGIHVPHPDAGQISLEASATIPIEAHLELRQYVMRGQAEVSNASLRGIDVDRLSTHISLAKGILELPAFQGKLVDRSTGLERVPAAVPVRSAAVPVAAARAAEEALAVTKKLASAEFRGRLQAELVPEGRLAVSLEGAQLPLAEFLAPLLPAPKPAVGHLTLVAKADGPIASLADPAAWTASGWIKQGHLIYESTTLSDMAARFAFKNNRLEFRDLSAFLAGQPFVATLSVDMTSPFAFTGRIDAKDWSMSELVLMTKSAAHSHHIGGSLTVLGDASGTLVPLMLDGRGSGRLDQFRAGPVPIGAVGFQWTIDRNIVIFQNVDSKPFNGRLTGEARVPVASVGRIEGTATLSGIDTDLLSKAIGDGELKLTGKANGEIAFKLPPGSDEVEADLSLSASTMSIQGVPIESMRAKLRTREGNLHYTVQANSLGGKVGFQGQAPLLDLEPSRSVALAEIQADGFMLRQLWKALGVTGPLQGLEGHGVLDANLRTSMAEFEPWVHGLAEIHSLRWGSHYPLGHLNGEVIVTPEKWRIENMHGNLFGGLAQGSVWGNQLTVDPRRLGFELEVDRASLPGVAAMLPSLSRHLSGFGTLRLAGRFDEACHATAEIHVSHARFFGLPMTQLHVPAELTIAQSSGNGWLHVRRWTARLAGGPLWGNASFRVGSDGNFHSETHFDEVDLESFARIELDMRRPVAGKLAGQITLDSPQPSQLKRLKGNVSLDLDDGSLIEVPVIREIIRMLGSHGGGLFQEGDLEGRIANEQFIVDHLALKGQLVQMHSSGTIGFNGQLNLYVLVNTSLLIPQAGQSLAALIPGFGDVRGRREATGRVASFLSGRLMKLRVTGNLRSPVIERDREIMISDDAVGFFADVFGLALDGR